MLLDMNSKNASFIGGLIQYWKQSLALACSCLVSRIGKCLQPQVTLNKRLISTIGSSNMSLQAQRRYFHIIDFNFNNPTFSWMLTYTHILNNQNRKLSYLIICSQTSLKFTHTNIQTLDALVLSVTQFNQKRSSLGSYYEQYMLANVR